MKKIAIIGGLIIAIAAVGGVAAMQIKAKEEIRERIEAFNTENSPKGLTATVGSIGVPLIPTSGGYTLSDVVFENNGRKVTIDKITFHKLDQAHYNPYFADIEAKNIVIPRDLVPGNELPIDITGNFRLAFNYDAEDQEFTLEQFRLGAADESLWGKLTFTFHNVPEGIFHGENSEEAGLNIQVGSAALTLHSGSSQPPIVDQVSRIREESKEIVDAELSAAEQNIIQDLHASGYGRYEDSVKDITNFLRKNGTLTVQIQPLEPTTALELVVASSQKPFGFLDAFNLKTTYK